MDHHSNHRCRLRKRHWTVEGVVIWWNGNLLIFVNNSSILQSSSKIVPSFVCQQFYFVQCLSKNFFVNTTDDQNQSCHPFPFRDNYILHLMYSLVFSFVCCTTASNYCGLQLSSLIWLTTSQGTSCISINNLTPNENKSNKL